jgi:hypothetical protein
VLDRPRSKKCDKITQDPEGQGRKPGLSLDFDLHTIRLANKQISQQELFEHTLAAGIVALSSLYLRLLAPAISITNGMAALILFWLAVSCS